MRRAILVILALLIATAGYSQTVTRKITPKDLEYKVGNFDRPSQVWADSLISRPGFTPINVTAFGVDHTGATDCSDSLQAVIDSVEVWGGGDIYLPPGDYLIGTTILLESNSSVGEMTLSMYGATLKKAAALNGPVIQLGDTTSSISNVSIMGGTIMPVSDTRDWDSGTVGIQLNSAYRCRVVDTHVRNFEKGIELAAQTSKGCVYNYIAPRMIYDCLYGIYVSQVVSGWSNDNHFEGGSVYYSSSLSAVDASAGAAIWMEPQAGASLTISGNYFEGVSLEYAGGAADGSIPDAIYGTFYNCSFIGLRYEDFDGTGALTPININANSEGLVFSGGDGLQAEKFTNLKVGTVLDARRRHRLVGEYQNKSGGGPVLELKTRGSYDEQPVFDVVDASDDTLFAVRGDGGIVTLSDPFDVRAYGAIGDGSTDDTAAIQAAIDACEAAGGGEVFLPGGEYLLSGTVYLGDGVAFVGTGPGVTIISVDASASFGEGIISSENGTLGNHLGNTDISIESLSVAGNQEQPSSGSARGIWLKNVIGATIRDVHITDTYDEGIRIYGIGSGDTMSSDILIQNCTVSKDSLWAGWNLDALISLTSYTQNATNSTDEIVRVFDVAVRDCFLSGGTQGVQVYNSGRVTIEGNHMESCDHRGVNIGPTSESVNVIGNNILNSGGAGIHAAYRNKRVVISGNICRNTVRDPSTVGQEGQGIKAYRGFDDLSITGNVCTDNFSDGIAVLGLDNEGEGFAVTGNTCSDNGRDGVRIMGAAYTGSGGYVVNGIISGNLLAHNDSSGIYVGSDTLTYVPKDIQIGHNTLIGNGRYGIEVFDCLDLSIAPCHSDSNTLGDHLLAQLVLAAGEIRPMTLEGTITPVGNVWAPLGSLYRYADADSTLMVKTDADSTDGWALAP